MLILAVETSCDDSAAAVLSGPDLLGQSISSQGVHAAHGGVVPELASRMHLSTLPAVVARALEKSDLPSGIRPDCIAATAGPGLVGSLLVGLSWAKALAFASGCRFIAVNHLAAHLHVHYPSLTGDSFPAVALLVSGGHTGLFLMRDWQRIDLLGCTRDDAAGEAFDKCAKLLGGRPSR